MNLSEEQKKIFELWRKKENLFITGPGGCGKTGVIKYIYENRGRRKLQICAMTGCAAVLLGCSAVTIHSWSGIRLGREEKEQIIKRIRKNYKTKMRWRTIECLIIDEISMMSVAIFELLNDIGKEIRGDERPFGGIQLLFAGDFFQLPPIDGDRFCFESPIWNEIFKRENHIEMRINFRQGDCLFQRVLNEIRIGELSEEGDIFLKRILKKKKEKDISPIEIYPLRTNVEKMNQKSFETIEGEDIEYNCLEDWKNEIDFETEERIPLSENYMSTISKEEKKKEIDDLCHQHHFMEKLKLKRGCSVMCTSNIDIERGICNGSQGIVRDIKKEGPIIEFFNGEVLLIKRVKRQSKKYFHCVISQFPLVYAYATTIHKIQGTTLDCAEMDIGSNICTFGQSYVALSRLKTKDGLYLKSFDKNSIKVHSKVKEFYKDLFKKKEIEQREIENGYSKR